MNAHAKTILTINIVVGFFYSLNEFEAFRMVMTVIGVSLMVLLFVGVTYYTIYEGFAGEPTYPEMIKPTDDEEWRLT